MLMFAVAKFAVKGMKAHLPCPVRKLGAEKADPFQNIYILVSSKRNDVFVRYKTCDTGIIFDSFIEFENLLQIRRFQTEKSGRGAVRADWISKCNAACNPHAPSEEH